VGEIASVEKRRCLASSRSEIKSRRALSPPLAPYELTWFCSVFEMGEATGQARMKERPIVDATRIDQVAHEEKSLYDE
jgi:hypothetical protein